MKRTTKIAAEFIIDGLSKMQRAMRTAAKGIGDVSKATKDLAKADVGKLADGLDDVASSAKAAEKAVDKLGDAGLKHVASDAGDVASGIREVAKAAAAAASAAAGIDLAALDPKVAARAVQAWKRSIDRGVELEFYVDKKSLVRLEKDQLRLVDKLMRTDLSAVSRGAVERAGQAALDAKASGSPLKSFTDSTTYTTFDAEQLEVAAEVVAKVRAVKAAQEAAAKAASDLADEQAEAAKGATLGQLAAKSWAKSLAVAAVAARAAKAAASIRPGDVGNAVSSRAGNLRDSVSSRAMTGYDAVSGAARKVASVRPSDVKNALLAKLKVDADNARAALTALANVRPKQVWNALLSKLNQGLGAAASAAKVMGSALVSAMNAVNRATDAALRAVKALAKAIASATAAIARFSAGASLATVTRSFAAVRTAATAATAAIRTMGTAGTTAATALAASMRRVASGIATATKAAAGLTAGLTAAAAVKIGGAAAFAKSAASDALQKNQELRSISALTGMSGAEVNLLQNLGASVGLEGTDLAQVMSGFTAAMREAKDEASDTGKAFARLGVGINSATGAANTFGLGGSTGKLVDGRGGGAGGLSSLYPGIYSDARKAQGQIQSTGNTFYDFINKANKLSDQERGQLFTQVFGEDDALKVAELANAVKDGQMGKFNENLITPAEQASLKAYKTSIVQLGNTFDWFKRILTVALEPLVSYWARVFKEMIKAGGPTVVQQYFVQPFMRLSNVLRNLLVWMMKNDGFRRFNSAIQATSLVVGELLKTIGRLALAFARALDPKQKMEGGYYAVLRSIWLVLQDISKWAADGRGVAAFEKLISIAKVLGGVLVSVARFAGDVATALDEMAKDRGIDLGKMFSLDGIKAGLEGAVAAVAAFKRDVALLSEKGGSLDLTPGDLETGFGVWIQKRLIDLKLLGLTIADVALKFEAKFSAAMAKVEAQADKVFAYLKKGWAEGMSAASIGDAETMLGKVLVLVRELLDYADRFQKAFRLAAADTEAKDMPKGFEWMARLRDTIGTLIDSMGKLHDAFKPVIDSIKAILDKFGGLNIATVALGGLIAAKVGSAIIGLGSLLGGLLGKVRAIGGLLGIGGAAAGGGAAVGAGAAAAGVAEAGAVAAGGAAAAGTLTGAVATLTTGLIATAGAIGGIILAAYGAYKLIEANVDTILNMVGMGSQSVQKAVSQAAATIEGGYASMGSSQSGNNILAARQAAADYRRQDSILDLMPNGGKGFVDDRTGEDVQSYYGPGGTKEKEIYDAKIRELQATQPPVQATFIIERGPTLKASGDMASMTAVANQLGARR